MVLNGMATQLKTTTLDLNDVTEEAVFIKECVGALPVFADLTTTDLLQNDFTTFLDLQQPGTDISYILLGEDCQEIATLNDNTFGRYSPQGFLSESNGYTYLQSLYVGFKLQWRNVLLTFGPGNYKIKKKINGDGEHPDKTSEECSCLFELCQYSDALANETVRIETTQNGNTISPGLEYLGVNWQEQIRIPGFFGNKQRRLEQDNYVDKNRNTTQIQDTLVHEFTLEPYFWPHCLRDQIDSILLANEILISDYNLQNTDDLKNISVIPTSIDTEYFGKSKKAADEIKFEERQKNRVKRNVK
tara:strand:- start:500 stop:1405 length:906 start_codon:yes stop_codon:yes gene_type:complete